ncbi:hypothetical protein SAMN02910322_00378 [Bacteroides thetaiotaomicron]|nr:hypothetical protein SAMN02910322_00378 [Bacteroides thetaiotaomicron]
MENQLETIKANLPYGYEKQIAKEVGCSQGTVHNILNNKPASARSIKLLSIMIYELIDYTKRMRGISFFKSASRGNGIFRSSIVPLTINPQD